MQQPSLPPMEPMKPAAPPHEQPAASSAAPPKPQAPVAQTKGRLRQIVGYIGGASLGFIILVGVGEMVLRPGIRPTDLMATIEARTDIGIFNQKMGAAPGEMRITEEEYRNKLAEAERSGVMKAELEFQRDLAAIQSDKERVVTAYQALYQRTNAIAQTGLQMEAVAQQFRQRLLEQTNGGRVLVISVYDGLCALGNADACESARQARAGMIRESGELSEGDLAKKINALMAGIPDPAALIEGRDLRENGTPTIER